MLTETAAEAARIVADGQASVVRYAAVPASLQGLHGVAQVGREADPMAPVDWMCAGKPVISYSALLALRSGGMSCDDDIRPVIPVTPQCPAMTLREVLTYRSGLVRGHRAGYLDCVVDPRLARPAGWDPAADAEYWNAGWEVLPALVRTLTGHEFEHYVASALLEGRFAAPGAFAREGMADTYLDRSWISNPDIRKVFLPTDLATSLAGPLATLCRFYQGILRELDGGAPGMARTLISSNLGPDFFSRGVSTKRRWALGFPHLLHDQGFERIVPPDGFGSQGSVLTLTSRGLQYAWVCVTGAIPSLRFAYTVAMDGLRPVPDARYLHMVAALMRDARALG
jgi:CubicO group peptidase (beta-lactamase class C family)